jgi:aminopeptidase-like protein
MRLLKEFDQKEFGAIGRELHSFVAELYPICRSITGDGIRKTLGAIESRIPLRLFEVPTGTRVLDWTVPKEWNIREAYIAHHGGKRIVDFQRCNLHVLNYSIPVDATISLTELRPHLFTIPEHPDWIPYRTSYYKENWGFCLSHNQMLALDDGEYDVFVDSTLEDGRLTYGEYYLPGRSTDEVLVLTCLGDAGGFHYKKSRQGNAEIDRAAAHVLGHCGESAEVLKFSPYGYDERQYCSPGFNLAVGCLMRSVWGTFPEYHTSADNLDFVQPDQLARSVRVCTAIVDVLENNRHYRNLSPYGEPQLGRRNLYSSTGGDGIGIEINACLWVLNQSDGKQSLLDIAEQSGIPFSRICDAAELLLKEGLLAVVPAATAEEALVDKARYENTSQGS